MPGSRRAPAALVVLDGWGLRDDPTHNAIVQARTPTYDALLARVPHSALVASGEAVGLPPGQMGNSEVGHMNLGAGRIVYQDLTRIDKSLSDGDFAGRAAVTACLDYCRDGRHALHLVGLVSDGGVHSHLRHLEALIELAGIRRLPRVFVHALTDGRDTSPRAGIEYVGQLERTMARAGAGRLASVSGRYFAMDRDRRWDRTARAYRSIVDGEGRQARSAAQLIESSYARDVTDEFIEPGVVVDSSGAPVGRIASGDAVVIVNFRADRARQLTSALAFESFEGFERPSWPRPTVTTMTRYSADYELPVIFEPQSFSEGVGEVLPAHGRTNLRLAETEKYAHVTYFFNCGEEQPYAGEARILVPSPKVATYDLEPAMSARGITDQFVADVAGRRHDVIICNFANADMVGHTGSLEATVAAVEVLDECLARIVTAMHAAEGTLLVTADHGNAEQMWDAERDAPHTAHTNNPVPLLLVGPGPGGGRLRDGSLRDVAPTLLGILGIEPSAQMTGSDLRTE